LYRAIAAQRLDGETYIADANRSWSVPTALRVARNLERYGFFNIEQPCNSYEECLRVRRQSRLTTAIDESVTDFDVLSKVARDDAADIVHIKLSRIGGITRARQMRDFCAVAGLSVSWAKSGGTELSDAAATHVAMLAERGISIDHSTIHRWVIHFSPLLLTRFNRRKQGCNRQVACRRDLHQGPRQITYLYRAPSTASATSSNSGSASITTFRPPSVPIHRE
jgi:L-alanine-DL-glutamate epimerase-like enolase superfamily enzyme